MVLSCQQSDFHPVTNLLVWSFFFFFFYTGIPQNTSKHLNKKTSCTENLPLYCQLCFSIHDILFSHYLKMDVQCPSVTACPKLIKHICSSPWRVGWFSIKVILQWWLSVQPWILCKQEVLMVNSAHLMVSARVAHFLDFPSPTVEHLNKQQSINH